MNNSSIETAISFRFLTLDKFQAYSLTHEILGATHKQSATSPYYVAYVPLTKQNFDDINDYYVRQRIDLSCCDIFISVTAESNSARVNIPEIVNRMLKYIDCKLTFSFSVI